MKQQPLIPPKDESFSLDDYDASYTGELTKDEAEDVMPALRTQIDALQDLLYADRRFALLIVLQGIDTAGKDGTIKSVFKDVGPLGCSVANFGVPSAEEAGHDFLWRYHRDAPKRGQLVIFNRSHYESVAVERVHEFVPRERWKARYGEINAFEAALTAEDTMILKFFLHISKDEQRERLQERVDNPKKRWKFRPGDLDERKRWNDYQAAFEDMIKRCSTDAAPWHVVPADRKWYRDVVVARAVIERLERAKLRYPEGDPSIAGAKVE